MSQSPFFCVSGIWRFLQNLKRNSGVDSEFQETPRSLYIFFNLVLQSFWDQIFSPLHQELNKHPLQAISCLKRALWVSPLNWKTLFNLGLAHLATSQPASAFNFICAAVNLRPDVPDCFAALGCKYCRYLQLNTLNLIS